MILQLEVEELRKEKESLKQRLESKIRQLEWLRRAYYEECGANEEEKRGN